MTLPCSWIVQNMRSIHPHRSSLYVYLHIFIPQVLDGKSIRIPRYMHQSRGWVDNWEWVRKWTRFCDRRILWIEGNQNSYLWGVFLKPPRNPHFVIGLVASSSLTDSWLYFLIEKTNNTNFVRVSSFSFDSPFLFLYCEQVQLMLESMYKLKVGGCHANFVTARDLLAH